MHSLFRVTTSFTPAGLPLGVDLNRPLVSCQGSNAACSLTLKPVGVVASRRHSPSYDSSSRLGVFGKSSSGRKWSIGVSYKAQSTAIPAGIASICNAADHFKRPFYGWRGLSEHAPSANDSLRAYNQLTSDHQGHPGA